MENKSSLYVSKNQKMQQQQHILEYGERFKRNLHALQQYGEALQSYVASASAEQLTRFRELWLPEFNAFETDLNQFLFSRSPDSEVRSRVLERWCREFGLLLTPDLEILTREPTTKEEEFPPLELQLRQHFNTLPRSELYDPEFMRAFCSGGGGGGPPPARGAG
jgi:hypothetical protein